MAGILIKGSLIRTDADDVYTYNNEAQAYTGREYLRIWDRRRWYSDKINKESYSK